MEDVYEITEQEALRVQLIQAEIDKAALMLQLLKERQAMFQRELAGKYSEYGTYELVGDLDLVSRKGTRRKVEA